MDIEQKRQALLRAYSGKRWADRVKRMGDGQVVALYIKFRDQNKI